VEKRFFYTNESTGLDAWEAELPITSKVFSTAFVWKNKAYKINEIQKKIAFYQAKFWI
jgi:hypothetical protein